MYKFIYKVSGISSTITHTEFEEPAITIEIRAKTISEATENIKQYLAHNYLKCDHFTLQKIEMFVA